MSQETKENGGFADETEIDVPEVPLTVKVILTAMVGGLAGMVLMVPLLVGVPAAFDLFRTDPVVGFSTILSYVGLEPSLVGGVALFVVGGTMFLPLLFLVVGAFLPPLNPRPVRGVTYATIFWVGFVMAFWPGGSALTIGVFLLVSLLAHWVYGATLAFAVDRTTGIPQHDV